MKPGQSVQVQLTPGSRWKSGKIIKKDETPRSYHVMVNNGSYRRNSRFIKEDKRFNENGNDSNETAKRFNKDITEPNNGTRKQQMEQINKPQRQQQITENEAESNNQNIAYQYPKKTNEHEKRQKASRYQWNHKDKKKKDTSNRPLTGRETYSEIHGYGSKQNRFGRIIQKPHKLDL